MCGTSIRNHLTIKRIRGDKLRSSTAYRKIKFTHKKVEKIKKDTHGRLIWGIYADSKVAAKTLAFGTECNDKPEVHQYGGYGHYHDSHHLIHIWFGKPQERIYEKKVVSNIEKRRCAAW